MALDDNSSLDGIEYLLHSEIPASGTEIDPAIDLLIHQRTRILNEKLVVLAGAIQERIRLHGTNVQRILSDDLDIGNLLLELNPHYGMRQYESRLQQALYQKRFDLGKERRAEDVECWRDIVMVMRDFLMSWEAHEQAKARAIFLKND